MGPTTAVERAGATMEYDALVAACANRILLDRDGVRLLENLYVEILLNVRCAHLFLPVRLSSLPNISPLHPAFVSLDDRGVLHDRQRRSRPVRRFGRDLHSRDAPCPGILDRSRP